MTGQIFGVWFYYLVSSLDVGFNFAAFLWDHAEIEHFLLSVGQIIIVFIYYSEESILVMPVWRCLFPTPQTQVILLLYRMHAGAKIDNWKLDVDSVLYTSDVRVCCFSIIINFGSHMCCHYNSLPRRDISSVCPSIPSAWNKPTYYSTTVLPGEPMTLSGSLTKHRWGLLTGARVTLKQPHQDIFTYHRWWLLHSCIGGAPWSPHPSVFSSLYTLAPLQDPLITCD